MVDLQNLRNAINEGQFSDAAKALMLPIVDAAIAKGSMTAEEKKKLQDIMDVEIDQNSLEQGAYEDAAEMIDSFLAETDAVSKTGSDNIDSLNKEVGGETQKIKNDLNASAQTQPQTVAPTQVPEPTPVQVPPMGGQPQTQFATDQPSQPVVDGQPQT
jgi:polyhydroxyalkanoate synthesis regulator phasin